MKLSEKTLKILKNFATINPSILIRTGNVIGTRSIAGNIFAEAFIEDEFPVAFVLSDLVQFLGTLKLFSSPILDFRHADQNFMYICEEDNPDFRVQYTFGRKDRIVYPKKRIAIDKKDVSFNMDMDILSSITKASNVMQLPNMMVVPGKDDHVRVVVSDVKDKSSNSFSIDIPSTRPKNVDFKLIFDMDTFKMIPADYKVGIFENRIAAFESDSVDYFIGLDLKSEYNIK
jgi:hypothetical protein